VNILFLDIANKTGWAHSNGDSGVWKLSKRGEKPISRLLRITHKLGEIRFWYGIDKIVAEAVHVRFASAAVSLAELHGAVGVWCATNEIEFINDVPATAIKKLATGQGNASKDLMTIAAYGFCDTAKLENRILTSDEADAICLRQYWMSKIDEEAKSYATQ
jgi:Holliday junction resolvasome RuvABC endonuclease subunit